jgi:putative redox protein
MDVLSILRKKRQAVHDCKITVSAERAESHPKVFTKVHVHFTVIGEGVKEAAVERAIELSHTKYCSAYAMLSATAEMSSSFEIVESPLPSAP